MLDKTREQLGAAQRWVIKIGSAMITNDGQGLDNFSIDAWVAQMAELHRAGREVLLVTSGAVAEGMRRLGWIGPETWIALETSFKEDVAIKGLAMEAERRVGKGKLSLRLECGQFGIEGSQNLAVVLILSHCPFALSINSGRVRLHHCLIAVGCGLVLF